MASNAVQRDWNGRGFSCDIFTDPPGQEWLDYEHETDELLMLKDGEIEVRFGGKVLRPKIGEEVFIPAHTRHTVINVGSGTNHWYYGYRMR